MKKKLVLILAAVLTSSNALAIDWNAEAFVTYKDSTSNADVKNAGTDLERLRVFLAHKFDENWLFKGRFEFKAEATAPSKVYLPEAHFAGSNIIMEGDKVKFGIQELPAVTMEHAAGNRWISKQLMDAEGFAGVSSTQSGISYGMKLASVNFTFFTLSGEKGDEIDTNDNNKLNGAMIDYKFNDSVTVWIQQTTYNLLAGLVKSTAVTTLGLSYVSEVYDAGLNYHQAAYSVETGTAPKNDTVMGVNGTLKKIGGTELNLYAQFSAGYDKYADTLEDTASKYLFGPTWALAEKLNMGIFYEAEQYQVDYKTANPNVKEPAALLVKMAAKF